MYSILLVATTIAGFIASSTSQSIDPNSVPIGIRNQWCSDQISQCPLICLQTAGNSAGTESNTCDPASLSYSCICSNGIAPNASEYSQTIPYYICTQFNTNCQLACGNDNSCAAACVQDHPCGATNPTRVNTTSIATMSATATDGGAVSTGTGGTVYSGFAGSTATATAGSTGKNAATRVALNFGQIYGLGVIAVSVFAGFTFIL